MVKMIARKPWTSRGDGDTSLSWVCNIYRETSVAYCIFTAVIPLANIVSFLLRYLTMHNTGNLPVTGEWESGYATQYRILPGSINQPNCPASFSEGKDNDGEMTAYNTLTHA